MTIHQLEYGTTTIEYQLQFAVRKTLAINVHPDLRVTVIAPHDTSLETVQEKVNKRAAWIIRQQRDFALYLPQAAPREYVSGETLYYLGRQYRLKVTQDASAEWSKLDGGYLYVRTSDKSDRDSVKKLVDGWYMRQAQRVFHERLREVLPRFSSLNLPEFELEIKTLQARWGSCSASGVVTLNLKLMQVPKHYIDYVIVHELCHLLEHNHSKRFYALLAHVMPDWQERRHNLNLCRFH